MLYMRVRWIYNVANVYTAVAGLPITRLYTELSSGMTVGYLNVPSTDRFKRCPFRSKWVYLHQIADFLYTK